MTAVPFRTVPATPRVKAALLLAAAGTVLLFSAALTRPYGPGVVLPLLIASSSCWVALALRLAVGPAARVVWWATFGSFAVRWFLAVVFYCASLYQWPLARSLQVGNGFWLFCMDALNYHSWAPRVLEAIRWGLPLPDPGATIDYYIVVAMIYGLFGTSPMTAIAFNILAWTLGVVGLIAIFVRLRGAPVPGPVAVILSFWPSGLIWPTQLMKDAFVLVFLVLAVGAAVALMRSRRNLQVVTSMVALWIVLIPLLRLRIYVGRILLAAALVTVVAALLLWVARLGRWRQIAYAAVVAAILYVGVGSMAAPDPFVFMAPADPASAYQGFARSLAARGEYDQARAAFEKAHALDPAIVVPTELDTFGPSPHGRAEIAGDLAPPISVAAAAIGASVSLVAAIISKTHVNSGDGLAGMAPDQLGAMRANFAGTGGDSATGLSARLQNWHDAIRLLPASMATGLFAPYPWDVIRPRGITGQFRTLAVSESIVTFLLMPSLVLGLIRLRRADELFVAAAALGGLLAVSLVVTNLGTLFRLRVAFTLLLMAFASYGFDVYGWANSMVRSSRSTTARLNGEPG